MSRIAVLSTVRQSYWFVAKNSFRLIKAFALPSAIYVALIAGIDALWPVEGDEADRASAISNAIAYSFAELVLVPAYVACHRLVLLPNVRMHWSSGLDWNRRELRYAAYSFIVIATVLPFDVWSSPPVQPGEGGNGTALGVAIILGGLASLILWAWLSIRFAFLFVAAPIGRPTGIYVGWRMTREYQLPLLFIGAFALLPLVIPLAGGIAVGLSSEIVSDFFDRSLFFPLAGSVIALIFVVVPGVIWVCAISFAYRTAMSDDLQFEPQVMPG